MMNRHRYRSDMEAAWELRPGTDETPGSSAHLNRFASSMGKPPQKAKMPKNTPPAEKNRENGS